MRDSKTIIGDIKNTIRSFRKSTEVEKDSYNMMKELLRKPTRLKNSDFKAGKIILYSYKAKTISKYDKTPLNMILGRSNKYTLCWAINWTPPKMREKVLDFIMKKNKKRIENGKDIQIDYKTIRKIVKGLGPVIRLYLNDRISPKGVVLSPYQYYKVVNLRAESFTGGLSSNEAWAMAIKNKRKKKRKS